MIHSLQYNSSLLSTLTTDPGYSGQIVHREWIAPQAARYADVEPPLPPPLVNALATQGITRLYTHQAAALQAARANRHVGVITATASGKSLCYQLPLIESCIANARNRALLIFPTKALAQDQLRSLQGLLQATPGLRAGIYDGDTPQPERAALRTNASLLLTNPDMLHLGILPNHHSWARFLRNLRFVVVDEAHIYRGVFGANVALVLRRLRRLCALAGSNPQFLCCSATIANPDEHLAALVGAQIAIINDDGAPRGSREFVFWNPPTTQPQQSGLSDSATAPEQPVTSQSGAGKGTRRSTNSETTAIFGLLVRSGVSCLTFTKARKVAELILRYAQDWLGREAPELVQRVAAYRAGYMPEQRRRIEQGLAHGELRGVISTNALELGVDIGSLDAVILNGYPGTVASTWQQVGRAGRRNGHSLAILVALEDPLDQFFMRHPEQFFGRSSEHARITLENPYILADHLRCAAYEHPLSRDDEQWFGPLLAPLARELAADGLLIARQGRAFAPSTGYPAQEINIRTSSAQQIELVDTSRDRRVIERIDASRALHEVHIGAVYLHQGEEYLVTELDLERRIAYARPSVANFYTQPREVTDIQIIETLATRSVGATLACFGEVDVTRLIVGYRRKAHYSEIVLGDHELDLPPQSFVTRAVWFTTPRPICRQVTASCGDLAGALHALEHAMISLLPVFALCDRWDIGGVSTALHPDTGEATVFIYDGVPGGVGLSELGYQQLEAWWKATHHLLSECPCIDGCPSCVQSPKCGNGNQPLNKEGARLLLELLMHNN